MKNVEEKSATATPRKAGIGLSVLMTLTTVVLGFFVTGVVAVVVRGITSTSFTFYGVVLLWLVLACAGLFAGQQILRRTVGIWAYLLATVLVVVFAYVLAWSQYLVILL